MFLVRNKQIDVLAAHSKDKFIKEMIILLQSRFTEIKDMPEQELHTIILAQITKANNYGLELGSSIASYIVTATIMGENFDTESKYAQQILVSDLDENDKCTKLENWLVEIVSALESK